MSFRRPSPGTFTPPPPKRASFAVGRRTCPTRGYLGGGHAREADPGLLAYQAVRAVAAYEVACAQLVGAVGTEGIERDGVVVLGQGGQFVPAPHGPAEFGQPLLQHPLQPALRHRQDVQRAGPEPGEVQLQRPEREARYRPGPGGLRAEPVEQAAVVQHRHDLAHQAVALGISLIPGSRSSTTGSAPPSRSSQASISPTGPPPAITMSASPTRPGGCADMEAIGSQGRGAVTARFPIPLSIPYVEHGSGSKPAPTRIAGGRSTTGPTVGNAPDAR
jgi:hypothetical protein